MRLIDADKLIEICRKGWKLFGRENEKLKHWVDEYDIRDQPTVKAIPIEWIEEYAKSLIIKRRFLAENGLKNNRCYDYMFGIIGMLGDWEKENE